MNAEDVTAYVDLAGLGAGDYELTVHADAASRAGVTHIEPATVQVRIYSAKTDQMGTIRGSSEPTACAERRASRRSITQPYADWAPPLSARCRQLRPRRAACRRDTRESGRGSKRNWRTAHPEKARS